VFEYGISAKWLELLKEIAPRVTRAAVLRDPANPFEIGQLGAIQSMAPSVGVELSPINVGDAGEIESAVTTFAREPNRGLIVVASPMAIVHRERIITLATRHSLPAVYPFRPSSLAAASSPTGLTRSPRTGVRPATSIASSEVRDGGV
jgi:putative ABC transport system substrate-binding protein